MIDSCPNQKLFVLWLSQLIFILYVWRRMVGSFTKLTTSLLTSHELARTFSAKLCAVCQLPSESEDVCFILSLTTQNVDISLFVVLITTNVLFSSTPGMSIFSFLLATCKCKLYRLLTVSEYLRYSHREQTYM